MKFLNLLMWVGQFGFSVIFPTLAFLLLAYWLRETFGFGLWLTALLGVLGLLTSVSTTKSCLRSILKAAQEASSSEEPPISFNDHT